MPYINVCFWFDDCNVNHNRFAPFCCDDFLIAKGKSDSVPKQSQRIQHITPSLSSTASKCPLQSKATKRLTSLVQM